MEMTTAWFADMSIVISAHLAADTFFGSEKPHHLAWRKPNGRNSVTSIGPAGEPHQLL
jgi:hypothetical protein